MDRIKIKFKGIDFELDVWEAEKLIFDVETELRERAEVSCDIS